MFSFHLADLPSRTSSRAMVRPPRPQQVQGLRHAEALSLMRLGSPSLSRERLQVRRVALFARREDAAALDEFVATDPLGAALATGWHVRLEFLRRYGTLGCLADLPVRAGDWDRDEPVVAVTLAHSPSTGAGRVATGCCRDRQPVDGRRVPVA